MRNKNGIDALQSISAKVEEATPLASDHLFSSIASFLISVALEAAPISALAHSPSWVFLAPAVQTIRRAAAKYPCARPTWKCGPCYSFTDTLLALLQFAEGKKSILYACSQCKHLPCVSSLPLLPEFATLLSPMKICASLVNAGMAAEAALLHWQTDKFWACHDFDLCASLENLLSVMGSSKLEDKEEQNRRDNAVAILTEWLRTS